MNVTKAKWLWLRRWTIGWGAMALAVCCLASPAQAVVKFFDGFGDADLNNNGTPLEFADVDANISTPGDYNNNKIVDAADYTVWRDNLGKSNPATPRLLPNDPLSTTTYPVIAQAHYNQWKANFNNQGVNTYVPGRSSNTALSTNPEVSSVLDANDTGLRWLFAAGFAQANTTDEKALIRIVDDTQGVMLETKPIATPGGLGVTAIDDGYALSYNSKGRGSSVNAFFDETIALGPEVGDQVKVSFDFRVYRDAYNANAFEQPADGELRFGLYRDTDNQLGLTNPVAGRDIPGTPPTMQPAIWGEQGGWFEGSRASIAVQGSNIGSNGDHGWFGAVILEDYASGFGPLIPNGGNWRIREETNEGSVADQRSMQGTLDVDVVAVPQEANPGTGDFGLVNLDVLKVYNISLTLERATDQTTGDTILSTMTATDRATGIAYTLSDFQPAIDGISSDSWDYFGIRNTGIDDFDFLIDNFMLEINGSNELGGSGGAALGSVGVPEPSCLALVLLGASAVSTLRRRRTYRS